MVTRLIALIVLFIACCSFSQAQQEKERAHILNREFRTVGDFDRFPGTPAFRSAGDVPEIHHPSPAQKKLMTVAEPSVLRANFSPGLRPSISNIEKVKSNLAQGHLKLAKLLSETGNDEAACQH